MKESEGRLPSTCTENNPKGSLPVEENSETTSGWTNLANMRFVNGFSTLITPHEKTGDDIPEQALPKMQVTSRRIRYYVRLVTITAGKQEV